jgi:Tetratricopeptide repeat
VTLTQTVYAVVNIEGFKPYRERLFSDFGGSSLPGLKRALELDEGEQNARLMLVNVYTKSGRYDEALEQANIFLAKNPKSLQRATLETLKEKIEKASRK